MPFATFMALRLPRHPAAEDNGAPLRVLHRGVQAVQHYKYPTGGTGAAAGNVRTAGGAPLPMVRCVVVITTQNPRDALLCRCRQLASLPIVRRSSALCDDRSFRRRGPSETPSSEHRSTV